MITKVLVANRGEIAVRVLATLRRLGIASVAVYSEADAEALHTRLADEAVCIGPAPTSDSYLQAERIIETARSCGADAIHPGYGFLAENAGFAQDCEDAGIIFIGPRPETIRAMGSKISARALMDAAGVQTVPGTLEALTTLEEAYVAAEGIGYPVAVKASGAGGGKGFRVAQGPDQLESAFTGARGEGERFFSDGTVYLERYLDDPRHVEVQILGDVHGNIVHLHERDCSIQRRHQKLVEEAPSPVVDAEFRSRITDQALAAARAVGYVSAGTVEGLVAGGEFYFLEMNTRIQVEHGVTELVTGVDIVEQQLRIANGEELNLRQDDIRIRGHAIECRVNAENAAKGFLPAPGTITAYQEPHGDGIRVDSGVETGTKVLPFYDSLLAKVLVVAEDRAEATNRMIAALEEFQLEGPKTLIPFHLALLRSGEWRSAGTAREIVADPRAFLDRG
ncbi:acetyl-CoA carboxylase biotin carboxylase subunit [Sediminivirga luteola]|uniref:biotin carboxylase n=1 Tax=Sediminivirga luteola TaxID=1774748 RepID=A0A8J2U092_9MICO|nr:acetyl-CoA carboxylase biotin carboxylase subunit [Sediminivirga luteola]GGA23797.1 biotin carboxylase [Sediminivirga luteola]